MEYYLRLVNDPEVRKSSINREPVQPENHKVWFMGKLDSRGTLMYLLVEENSGVPAGQIRFDLAGNRAEVDYSVDPAWRSRGIGTRLLTGGCTLLKEERPEIITVQGLVREENSASRRCFEKSGFEISAEKKEPGFVSYGLRLR